MTEYNFDEIIDRRDTDCVKWDETAPGVIPMWVADMDFRSAPAVVEAVERRAAHGVYGYTYVRDSYYDAVIGWFERRHGWKIADRSHILYTTGVVPALSAALYAIDAGERGVVLTTPVYNCFFSSVRNTRGRLVELPLDYDAATGRYSLDFDRLRLVFANCRGGAFVLCNPHNPVGRIWSDAELEQIATLARDAEITVVADEIHCELTLPGLDYTPFAPVAERVGCRWVALSSPSKAFNTAGLRQANIVCADPDLRARIDRAINDMEICDVGPFGVDALIAAYNHGAGWLDALREYIAGNFSELTAVFGSELPALTITPLEATYLAWVNIAPLGQDSDRIAALLESEAGVKVSAGSIYGEAGKQFIRINLATPRATLREGLKRIVGKLRAITPA